MPESLAFRGFTSRSSGFCQIIQLFNLASFITQAQKQRMYMLLVLQYKCI